MPKLPHTHILHTLIGPPRPSFIREQGAAFERKKATALPEPASKNPLGHIPELGGREKPAHFSRDTSLMTEHSNLQLSLAVERRVGAGKVAARPRPHAGANREKLRDDPGSKVHGGDFPFFKVGSSCLSRPALLGPLAPPKN